MRNREICKQARKAYQRNWKTLLPATAIICLLGCSFSVINIYLERWTAAALVFYYIAGCLLYPILTLGYVQLYLAAWRGETPKLGMLLQFYKGKQPLVLGAVMTVILSLSRYVDKIDLLLKGSKDPSAVVYLVVSLLSLALILAYLYLTLRLLVTPYAFVSTQEAKAADSFKRSLSLMKGSVLRVFRLSIRAYFWAALLGIAILVLFFGLKLHQTDFILQLASGKDFSILLPAGFSLLSLLCSPLVGYARMVLAGFADEKMKKFH